MLISCKCLNILLKSASDLPTTLSPSNHDDDINQLQLFNQHQSTSDQQQQQQLQQHLQECTVNKLKGDHLQFFKTAKISSASIVSTIQHRDLINVTLIENWNVYKCIHCKTVTHAQANDSTKLLMNPLLLTNQEKINMIKSNKNFSKSFNIVLLGNLKETTLDKTKYENLSGRSKELKQHLHDVMQQETEATEERIERYAKQQQQLLKIFCEKAKQDYQDIISTLDDVPENSFNDGTFNNDTLTSSIGKNSKFLSDLTPPVTPDSTPMSIGNSPNFRQQTSFLSLSQRNTIAANIKKTVSKFNHSTPDKTYQRSNANVDDDIFFEMDGLDTTSIDRNNLRSFAQSDDEDNVDNDDRDFDSAIDSRSGIKISSSIRQNVPKFNIAQSLPMAVPIFNQRNEEDYEEYADDNVDIAASIKALAKSVHGEAIFGDLPRPRFSTQI